MKRPYPSVLVQLSTREKVNEFRAGLGASRSIVALGLDAGLFLRLAGLDAVYLSITRAERWISCPPAPHTAVLARTTDAERQQGMVKYVFSGLVLEDGEPNTAEYAVPLVVNATRTVMIESGLDANDIRTIEFCEYELTFPCTRLRDVARALASAVEAV